MRTRRTMLVALAAIAATALAVVVPTGAAGAATFGTPVVVTGQDTGEPGIDVAPDGTLYVNAPSGFLSNVPGSPSFVFRSTDGGASWTQVPAGQRANLPGGGDSDVAVDQTDGTVYLSDLWLGSSTVAVSHDRGDTWTANPLGGAPVQDRQWTATAGGGRVYLTYNQLPSGLIVSKSTDGGVVYLPAGVAATPLDRTGCICPPGNIIAEGTSAATDNVGVIYADSSGGVGFAKSTNGALTFTRTTVSTTNGADTSTNFPVVANAGGNKLVAIWQEVVNHTTRVRMSTSSDWGTSWSAAKTIVSEWDVGLPMGRRQGRQGRRLAVPHRRRGRDPRHCARGCPVVRAVPREHRRRRDLLGPGDRRSDRGQDRPDLHRRHRLFRGSGVARLPAGGDRRCGQRGPDMDTLDRRAVEHGDPVRTPDRLSRRQRHVSPRLGPLTDEGPGS
jgi:hypothetical protein